MIRYIITGWKTYKKLSITKTCWWFMRERAVLEKTKIAIALWEELLKEQEKNKRLISINNHLLNLLLKLTEKKSDKKDDLENTVLTMHPKILKWFLEL